MQFFRTLIAVCSGPSVFPGLMNRNPFRAVFHLLLLCVLLALVISAFRIAGFREPERVISRALTGQFGSVVVRDGTVLPEKNAKQAKSFILTRSLRLDYLPDSAAALKNMGRWRERTGIIWTPRGFLLWGAVEGETAGYVLIPMPLPSRTALALVPSLNGISSAPLSAPEIERYVRKNYYGGEKPLEGAEKTLVFPIPETVAAISSACHVFIGVTAFAGLFFSSLMITFLFAAAQSLFTPKGAKRPAFPRLMTIMVYAAFPPLIIASLFTALSLPFFGFQTVFLITFFIYQMLAFSAVYRHLNPPPPPEDDEDFY